MLKLNVGFNRKVGESNYGSRGASVNLELELSSELASDPEKLKERMRQMFLLAKASVDEELNSNANSHANNGHATNGNSRRRDSTRKSTASQVRALHAISDRNSVNLPGVLQDRFGINQAEELTITEASSLIDELKSQANANGKGGHN